MAKMVMVIDTKRCTGCHTCAFACKLENNLPDNVWWNQVFTGTVSDFAGDRSVFTECAVAKESHLKYDVASGSIGIDLTAATQANGGLVNNRANRNISMSYYTKACQHCQEPACLKVCPTEAIYADKFTGAVDTDFNACIGCQECIKACPYDVRHYNMNEKYALTVTVGGQGISRHKDNTVDKCSFCNHRLTQKSIPACVEACCAQARHFGNLDDITSDVYKLLNLSGRTYKQLLPNSGTKPSIYYLD